MKLDRLVGQRDTYIGQELLFEDLYVIGVRIKER
jgi:hypothetical protein